MTTPSLFALCALVVVAVVWAGLHARLVLAVVDGVARPLFGGGGM